MFLSLRIVFASMHSPTHAREITLFLPISILLNLNQGYPNQAVETEPFNTSKPSILPIAILASYLPHPL
jgi:hypothetical protein